MLISFLKKQPHNNFCPKVSQYNFLHFISFFFRIIWRFQKKFVTLPQTAECDIVCLSETYAKHINIITKSIKPNKYETKIYLSAFPDAYVHLRGK